VPANYAVGQEVDLLVVEETSMGFKAVINNKHWGLIHKNEVFKFLRSGKQEKGFIKEIRSDGNISLSLQPVGEQLASSLNTKILDKLRQNNGVLPVSDKSDPAVISNLFGVSKGNFKKAIGALYKQGQIVIHADRIELV
jgi:predicted RNA-binding protein (virulence factor B family)